MSDNAAERTAGRQVGLVSGQGRTDIPGLSGKEGNQMRRLHGNSSSQYQMRDVLKMQLNFSGIFCIWNGCLLICFAWHVDCKASTLA